MELWQNSSVLWLVTHLYFKILCGRPTIDDIILGVPNLIPFVAVLLAHEVGHLVAAKRAGLELGPPFFIPSLQVTSLGFLSSYDAGRVLGMIQSWPSF